jgi:hypothetical protein
MQVQNIHSKDKFLSNNIYDTIIENNDIDDDIHNNINSTSNESLINESNSFKNIFITNKNKFINMAKFLSNDTTCNMMFFSKTQMCKNNNCPFGERCKFAHSYNELVCQTTLPCLYGPYCIIDSCQRKHFSFNDTKLLHENIYNKISKVKLNLKNDLKKQNLFNNHHYLKDFNLEGMKSYDSKNNQSIDKVPDLNLNQMNSTINRERKRFINSNNIKDIKDKSPLNTTSTTPTNISPRERDERDEKKYILLKEFLKKNSTYKSNHSNKDDIYNDTISKIDYDYP